MIKPIFEIALYLSSIIEVFGVSQVISSSFQGDSFSDADNWVVSGAQPQFTDCAGHRLFGGYNAFAKKVSLSKIFALPPHTSINLKVQFWKIDSWDKEEGFIFVDYQMAWQKKYNYNDGISMCGGGEQWKEVSVDLDLNIKHSGPTAIVVFTTTLDEEPDNESWGFRDFILSINNCPDGCLVCQEADTILECYVWKVIQTSWNQLDVNEIVTDGWNVVSGISEATQCGSVALFGGYAKTGTQTIISKSFFNIPPHYKLKIQFLFAKIDSWDNEAAQLRVDSVLVWEKIFQWYQGYYGKICGDSVTNHRTMFLRIELDIQHTNSQVETKFSTTLDEPTDEESFGLRDFIIFYGSCTDNCAQCTGPSGSECQMCAKGCYNTGVNDKICQFCYPSCYQCNGPSIEDCTDCGDPNIYHKLLVNGQCVCQIRTIEQFQNDGTTICQPCHPSCEKCYQPFDTVVFYNFQTCSQLLYFKFEIESIKLDIFIVIQLINIAQCAQQDRIKLFLINLIAFVKQATVMMAFLTFAFVKSSYIKQITECHYTCENCNGSLATNCTSCSSLSNRHLTSDNQCLCNKAYIDTGINNVICSYICHHACSDCDVPGEDQCTNCPATRQPDISGSTFKCLCKDSHYFSDVSQLDCLECHFTCKTCNGIYDNTVVLLPFITIKFLYIIIVNQKSKNNFYCNCLTCDLAYRQLIMFKCICPYGYYDVGSLQCSPCYYTCMTCFGPEEDNCITCAVSTAKNILILNNIAIQTEKLRLINVYALILVNSIKLINCIQIFKVLHNTYMEKSVGDPMCYKCSYRCANCIGTLENCTSCPNFSYRDLGTNNACSCPPKSYDQPGNPICIICHSTCLTCNGAQSVNCTSCNAQIMRQLDPSGSCLCLSKYYDVGQPECLACSAYCLDCVTSADNCISCKPDRFLQGNTCICKTKLNGATISSYQAQSKIECQNCHYSCLTCNGSTYTKCQSCLNSEMRILQVTSCVCAPHYFDIVQFRIIQCNYTCETCAVLDIACLTCYPNSFRNLSNQQCLCQKGYFDDGSNSICQKCHYSCSQCSSISTKCDACSLTSNRLYNSSMFTCNCLDSYYDSGVETCSQCHYSCFTCSTFGFQQCQSCKDNSTSFRVLNSGICQCLPGYYDDGISPNCKQCQIQCLTCQNTANYCTTCITTRHLEGNTCVCDTGYFVNKLNKCSKCDQNCINCIINSKNCTECDQTLMRILDNVTQTCICKTGTTEVNGLCQVCDIPCLTCQNSITHCTSCKLLRLLINNQCYCIDGTFESGNDKQCLQCNKTCFTCINQENYCTSCSADKNRIFKTGNICICQDGYYEDSVTLTCKQCDKSCLTCKVSPTYCLTCDASYCQVKSAISIFECFKFKSLELQNGKLILMLNYQQQLYIFSRNQLNRICYQKIMSKLQFNKAENFLNYQYNLSLDVQNRCVCSTGFYFNTSTLKCEVCNISCKECKTLTQCIDCENLTRYIDSDNLKCPCKDGYYEANLKKCSLCDLTCKTCINLPTKCLSCVPTYFRVLNNSNQCICLDGYYDIGIEMCQQCNLYCKTCQMTSTKCTSCNSTQNFRLLSLNQCICQNGYYDNGQLICQKCSNQCLTCKARRDNCTSCDTNQNRIDQSAINNCPCSSGFYQDQNENCSKCNLKCQTCTQSGDNCISCAQSNTSNRQAISKNCICKDGYFDDGNQVDCQKCSTRCKLCLNSSNNCLTCFSNLRDTPPICNCKFGFFENSSLNCEACENQCLTCEKSATNCLSCKLGRSTQQCICEDGYFEGGQPLCVQCDFQCKTCKDSSLNCLSCKGDRINNPICECPDGFYDDLLNEPCQVCDGLCKTCNVDGCLICNGNRVLTPEMSCDQPQNSVSHPDTPWCSTCEAAVVEARFSDDLLSIWVKFDFPLNPSFFTTQFQDNVCLKILDDQTYQLLGKNPICYIDPDDDKVKANLIFYTKLILKVGQQVKIIPGDKIQFYDNYFGHQECETKLNVFIFNQIKNPINPVSPKIIYDLPTYLINPCDDNTIPLKSKQNDGLRPFIGIKWTYSVDGSNGNGELDQFVTSLTNLQMLELVIPFKTLPKQSNITFYLEFQNFVAQKNIQMIKLQTHSGQFPTVLWISKPYYYAFETIVLQFQIKKKDCSESAVTQIDNSEYSVSIVEVYRNESNSRPSRVNYSEITRQNFFNVTIQNYTLTSRIAYTFQQTTLDALLNFSITRNVTLEISSGGIVITLYCILSFHINYIFCQFNGTKKIQNYRKETFVYISCRDLDTQYDWNEDSNIQINVECVDLTMNSLCIDLNKKIIKVNKTESTQILPKQTIQPYTIQSWTVWLGQKKFCYFFNKNQLRFQNSITQFLNHSGFKKVILLQIQIKYCLSGQ